MIGTLFKFVFAKYHVFCKWIMVCHLVECNKKENLGKKIKNHFRKPFFDLECSNFAESVFRLTRNNCKITFFYSENRPTLINNNEYAGIILLDFKKAFDTVLHSILRYKLEHYGIRGITSKLLKSYLSDRF